MRHFALWYRFRRTFLDEKFTKYVQIHRKGSYLNGLQTFIDQRLKENAYPDKSIKHSVMEPLSSEQLICNQLNYTVHCDDLLAFPYKVKVLSLTDHVQILPLVLKFPSKTIRIIGNRHGSMLALTWFTVPVEFHVDNVLSSNHFAEVLLL